MTPLIYRTDIICHFPPVTVLGTDLVYVHPQSEYWIYGTEGKRFCSQTVNEDPTCSNSITLVDHFIILMSTLLVPLVNHYNLDRFLSIYYQLKIRYPLYQSILKVRSVYCWIKLLEFCFLHLDNKLLFIWQFCNIIFALQIYPDLTKILED